MKVGDLVKDFDDHIGIVMTMPRLSRDCESMMDGDIYEVVDTLMPWGTEQFTTDELELVNESR